MPTERGERGKITTLFLLRVLLGIIDYFLRCIWFVSGFCIRIHPIIQWLVLRFLRLIHFGRAIQRRLFHSIRYALDFTRLAECCQFVREIVVVFRATMLMASDTWRLFCELFNFFCRIFCCSVSPRCRWLLLRDVLCQSTDSGNICSVCTAEITFVSFHIKKTILKVFDISS